MSEARCDKTDLLVTDCAHCRGNDRTIEEQFTAEAALRKAAYEAAPGWIISRYPGDCAECGERFEAGEMIYKLLDVGWISTCCAHVVG